MSYFEFRIQDCQMLLEAERLGTAHLLAFTDGAKCHECMTGVPTVNALRRCSGCSSVLYCSKKCQLLSWKGTSKNPESHKALCSRFKRHIFLVEEVQTLIKSFPWGRVEPDGTFYHDCALARFNVLGGDGFGFWSQSGWGLFEEEEEDEFLKIHLQQCPAWGEKWKRDKEKRALVTFIDGQDLLKEAHLNDADGWKLPASLTVRRCFPPSAEELPPSRLCSLIRTWDEWHSWRGVSKSSPASLLMHFPLSIYWMIVNTLKLTCITSVEPNNRPRLTIHYIGAEKELNFVPIFSELALLLPNHDLDLVFFGPCIFYIGQKSLEPAHRSSLLAPTAHDNSQPVFTYTAPDSNGYGRAPDAILACNAGLFTYDASEGVYMLEGNAVSMAALGRAMGVDESSQVVELNPFHRPGQRFVALDNMAPNLVNGFTMAVYSNKPAVSG
ncbi:hypothetical protein GGX14DRAFT_565402 [Mycena pura]|uniref:MYND-type domain-containing protein n=1 Tax=Mycena pura TaxID=153505 RepID=A0AAD6YDM9_9AGAR|nr:hypothetical protein GGX14DRAFT_565402 [Mycena pura]